MTIDEPVSSLTFTETMRGHAAPDETEPHRGARLGRQRGMTLAVELAIKVADVGAFLRDPAHLAQAQGSVAWKPLRGQRPVSEGTVNLFPEDGHRRGRELRYRLPFEDAQGEPLTLLGFKTVRDDPGLDLWKDTTTLFVWLLRGHVEASDDLDPSQVRGAGIIRIHALDFVRELLSFQAAADGRGAGLRAKTRFAWFFAGELQRRHYANPLRTAPRTDVPVRPVSPILAPTDRRLPHRPKLERTVVPFEAGDGRRLHLIHVHRRGEEPHRGPVLLAHGAALRGDSFEAPVRTNLVDMLVEHGFDVWLENWRGSTDVLPSQWNLDQVAVYDHPYAVDKVVACTGAKEVKAVVHCVGSITFTMSAVAGLLRPEVTTIISSAVSLHPVIPTGSRVKIKLARPIIDRFTDYMNPRWSELDEDPGWAARALVLLARTFHRECSNTVCKMVSFTYGYGFPALWEHGNINDDTHDWVRGVFGACPMSFFNHMAMCVASGRIVPTGAVPGLPADLAERDPHPHTDARFVFLAGTRNKCFRPESQVQSYRHFDRFRPGFHKLHLLEGYSHMDVFTGQRAALDVFPTILGELDRSNLPPGQPQRRILPGQEARQLRT
jgi:hypothetical protein